MLVVDLLFMLSVSVSYLLKAFSVSLNFDNFFPAHFQNRISEFTNWFLKVKNKVPGHQRVHELCLKSEGMAMDFDLGRKLRWHKTREKRRQMSCSCYGWLCQGIVYFPIPIPIVYCNPKTITIMQHENSKGGRVDGSAWCGSPSLLPYIVHFSPTLVS